ncbi:TonB-dependent siderophore receptor [Brucella sp. ZJ1_1]|uniref:Heme transporter BhuA n=2 Tax=Brucella intermedia TaxID=94625 RepID=C4WQJ7_9HYPH|nr:TonB-dependent siderophore receptor [Brucella intermedia]EEQ94506.1 TonB-dependent siderophore receptor [Brucella intermedia LMG 3301]ELT49174.1 ferrichrome receptor precursor protein [Brucella intermedia M86]KAB2707408.1 TonB-dependent siderophore receptor [Brucella intermedia]MCO7738417.1 TonB-dependent siderophore receptor [Brucella intermedia]OOC51727.1 ferrichrome-iron receptor [Brucella intermedia M86]
MPSMKHNLLALLVSGTALASIPASAQEANKPLELNTVVIQSDGNGGTTRAEGLGPVKGFVPRATITGSKDSVAIDKIPQSVSVVGRDQMDALGAQKIDEALRYTPGVLAQPFGVDNDTNWLYIRGFDATANGTYLDGLQNFSYGFGGFLIDSFGIERIDVLRGPASALYGGANPGGIVNYISKRPTGERLRYLEAGINSYGNGYLGFDIGDKATETVNYRVNGKIQGGDNYTDFSKEFRGVISPSIEYKPDESTSLTILANYTHLDLTHDGGFLPYYGTVVPTEFGKISRKANFTEPDVDSYDREQLSIGYEFEHTFDSDWTIRQNVRYGFANVREHSLYPYGYDGFLMQPAAGNPYLARINFKHDTTVNTFQADNQLEGKVTTGAIDHNLLFGAEYRYFRIDQMQQTGGATIIDAYNPVYGEPQGPMWDPYIDQDLRRNQVGVYAQDRMEFGDGWILTLNGRYDHIWTEASGLPSFEYDTGRFSGRAGLGYEFENGITPYVSAATFFNPIIETLYDGSYAKPETGVQYEAGVKYRPTFFDGLITASFFDLTKENSLTGSSFAREQLGKVNSRGFELEMQANIAEDWKVTASVTAYDLKVKENASDGSLVGKRPYLMPEHQASVFVEYTVPEGALKGVTLGGGVRYVGSSYADEQNTLKVPAVALADLKIGYEKDNWGIDLNVTNLFDKDYVAGCQGVYVCGYGEGRKALLRVHTQW